MFLASVWVQGIIILGLVVLFFGSFILNKKTKVPEGVELPEKCQTCPSTTCIINVNKIEEIKKEILVAQTEECQKEE